MNVRRSFIARSILAGGHGVGRIYTVSSGDTFYGPAEEEGRSTSFTQISSQWLDVMCLDLPSDLALEKAELSMRRSVNGSWEVAPLDEYEDVEDDAPAHPEPTSRYRITSFLLAEGAAKVLLGKDDESFVLLSGIDDPMDEDGVVNLSESIASKIFPSLDIPDFGDAVMAEWVDGAWHPVVGAALMRVLDIVWCTTRILRGKAPVVRVIRDDDGELQFLDKRMRWKGIPRRVHLRHLIEDDPTLADLPELSVLEGVVRDAPGAPWRRLQLR